MEAASTAEAWPSRRPSTRCSSVPTPPEAMTGTGTASATARVRARSKPALVPSRSIEVRRISPAPRAAMGEDFPAAGSRRLGVDGDDDALPAELLRRLADKLRPPHGLGVDRDLVRPGEQEPSEVLDAADAAADGERHEALLGGSADRLVERIAPLGARRDIEEAELVGAFPVVVARLLDGIARIGEPSEIDALDHPPVLDVEAGNEPSLQHDPAAPPRNSLRAAAGSMRPS